MKIQKVKVANDRNVEKAQKVYTQGCLKKMLSCIKFPEQKNWTFLFSEDCDPAVWREVADVSANGGVRRRGVTTLADCQSLCIHKHDCQAINWNPRSKTKCWLHIGSIGSQKVDPGVTHYILLERCPQRKQSLFSEIYRNLALNKSLF